MLKKSFICFIILTTALVCLSGRDSSGHSGGGTALARLFSGEEQFSSGGESISRYDAIIQEESRREGLDWRLVSAIAYNESRFDATVVSPKGAVGLMQVMPSVAQSYGVEPEKLADPRTNVRMATRIIRSIERSLGLPRSTASGEKIRIMLACYNGGVGHVADARRLASKYGENPDSWSDVSSYLYLKAYPEFYEDDAVRCGAFRGSPETINFVERVMGRYEMYVKKVDI